jgi:hypothetical protein
VEPSERRGTRAGTYSMTEGTELAWSVQLPFTLWNAAVAEDGRVAGYTYTGDFEDPSSLLHVVLLSTEGRVLVDETHERRSSGYSHSSPGPIGLSVFIQPELGRFGVYVANRERSCRAYDLATGVPLFEHEMRLEPAVANAVDGSLAVVPIATTPLLLLAWRRTDFSVKPAHRGGIFQLVDERWSEVWRLELPHDYEAGGDRNAERALWGQLFSQPPILSTGAARFDLRFVAESQRVSFAVERKREEWKVREVRREPYLDPDAPAPSIVPRPLARVFLQSARAPIDEPGRAAIDSSIGWILIEDRRASGSLHVFDSGGQQLALLDLEAELGWSTALSGLRGGRIDIGDGRNHRRFGLDGSKEPLVQLEAEGAVFLRDGDGYFGTQGPTVVRCSASGDVELRLEKRPDGHWFRDIEALAVSPDGALAVLDQDEIEAHRPVYLGATKLDDPALSLYAADGSPVRSFVLPDELPARSIVYQGARVLLAGDALVHHLLDLEDGRLFRMELGEESPLYGSSSWRYGLSRDGRELWVLETERLTLARYALPD